MRMLKNLRLNFESQRTSYSARSFIPIHILSALKYNRAKGTFAITLKVKIKL